jgi:hypothetical protein
MGKYAGDLIQGMSEAAAFATVSTTGSVVHVIDVPDVPAIRR